MIENSPRRRTRQKTQTDWRAGFRDAGPYLGLGMQLAAAMAFFTGVGYLLDAQFETTPWLTVAGGVLGMVAVFVQLVRTAQRLSKENKERTGRAHDQPGPPARD